MAKAKEKRTLVTFLLDRTGSMASVKHQTIVAYNEYVDELRKSKAPIDFTLLQFDTTSLDKVCVAEPVANAPKLDDNSYVPRASTNLIDCAYMTIKAVEGQEKAKGAKIVVCIQTDGEENSSVKHTWKELKDLIAEKTKAGWQFIFMGCGIDAYAQGAQMGIPVGATVSYGTDLASNRAVFRATASNTTAYASGLVGTTNYTLGQKIGSGDKFIPKDANLDLNENKAGKDSDLSL